MRNPRRSRIVITALLLGAISGCQSSGATSALSSPASPVKTAGAAYQLIVKLRKNTLPCSPAGIAELSAAVRIRLEYVRPVSGDACVIRQITEKEADPVSGQQRLRRHPAVEWVELDGIVRPY